MTFRLKHAFYYGWIIVVIFLIVQAVMMGINSSFTVFLTHIESAFSLSRTTTSAVSSVSWALIPLTAFAGGWALDRYGPRIVLLFMGLVTGLSLVLTSRTTEAWQLFITYSLLFPLGFGAVYAIAIATISRWFDKKRGVAVGIAGSGEGIGSVVLVPLSTLLIARFDWKTAYLILGFIAWALVIPLSIIAKKDPEEVGLLPDGLAKKTSATVSAGTGGDNSARSGLTLAEIIKTRSFWCVAGIWFLFAFSMLMLITHIVPHLTGIGISEGEAALVVGVFGVARAVGMIGLGVVADRAGRKKIAVISTLFQAGAILSMVWLREPWMFYLFAVVYGLANGGLFSGTTPLLGDTFGLDRLGAVLGLLEIGWGAGGAVGPLIGGVFYDVYGSYTLAFVLGAAATVLIIFLVIALRPEVERNFK